MAPPESLYPSDHFGILVSLILPTEKAPSAGSSEKAPSAGSSQNEKTPSAGPSQKRKRESNHVDAPVRNDNETIDLT
jgi:hypothetical protein